MTPSYSPDDLARELEAIAALPEEPNGAAKIGRLMALVKAMKNIEGPEYDAALYKFLSSTKDRLLRGSLRSFFAKRPSAEAFLVTVVHVETASQIEALQALGAMHSQHAAPVAREFLTHHEERHREVALMVLGWVGDEQDMPSLKERMLNEKPPRLRKTAASAFRQIAWRRPEAKPAALRALKEGFEHEQSDEVLPWLIVMIATVAAKNLGLREDRENPDLLHGDLQRAKKKAAAFLDAI
jgi:HEAT repeat protein